MSWPRILWRPQTAAERKKLFEKTAGHGENRIGENSHVAKNSRQGLQLAARGSRQGSSRAKSKLALGISARSYDARVRSRSTGKERDAETGLDYFGARYYSNGLGRWVTPDAPLADQHLQNPQSWNLYMYAANRPTSLIDTDGREVKETAKTVTYDVHGKTVAEAHANALATSSLKTPDGEAMMGVTNSSMQVTNIVKTSENDGYEGLSVTDVETVKSADVKLDQTTTMPNWVEQNQASPEDQAAWNKEMSDLKEHEDGHGDINRQGAHELDKSLPGTRGVGNGSTSAKAHTEANKKLTGALSKKTKDQAARTQQRQVDYDKKTDHGRKQHEEQK